MYIIIFFKGIKKALLKSIFLTFGYIHIEKLSSPYVRPSFIFFELYR